jgi:nucleotide-binding universal stress UspA family protein
MRILLAIDASSENEHVLSFGTRVAQHSGEPLTLLAVIEPGADHASHLIEERLAGARSRLQARPMRVQTRVRAGRVADEILLESQEGAYDLIVMAENGRRSPARRWHPAWTPLSVIKRACCSVAVVKGRPGPIHRILLCDSGAHGPTTAPPGEAPNGRSVSERFARRFPELFDKDQEVTILHVMSQISAGPGVRGKQLRADAVELMGELTIEGDLLVHDVRLLAEQGVQARARVRHGMVVDEILAEARAGDYGLVVIGSPEGDGWRRFLLDDLAAQIVEQVDRPVLVVR